MPSKTYRRSRRHRRRTIKRKKTKKGGYTNIITIQSELYKYPTLEGIKEALKSLEGIEGPFLYQINALRDEVNEFLGSDEDLENILEDVNQTLEQMRVFRR